MKKWSIIGKKDFFVFLNIVKYRKQNYQFSSKNSIEKNQNIYILDQLVELYRTIDKEKKNKFCFNFELFAPYLKLNFFRIIFGFNNF